MGSGASAIKISDLEKETKRDPEHFGYNITVDPKLTENEALKKIFGTSIIDVKMRIIKSSPAINKGLPISNFKDNVWSILMTGIDGKYRPITTGKPCDIGPSAFSQGVGPAYIIPQKLPHPTLAPNIGIDKPKVKEPSIK